MIEIKNPDKERILKPGWNGVCVQCTCFPVSHLKTYSETQIMSLFYKRFLVWGLNNTLKMFWLYSLGLGLSWSYQFSNNGLSWFQSHCRSQSKCDEKVSAVDAPVARIQKDGLQTWQWRAGVMDSTKSLIKILIETIRQWQIHCDLDPSWHDQCEPVKMPHPWRAVRSLEEMT